MSTNPPSLFGRLGALVLTAALALAASGAAQPPDSPKAGESRVSVPEDLFAVITLRGKPCGGVVSYERLGESDYRVTCKDGHRYRVYVREDGRVAVEEVR